jgi:hypothetical protein
VLAELDCTKGFGEQSFEQIQKVRQQVFHFKLNNTTVLKPYQQAVERYPFLEKYSRLWPVDDLIRAHLKYQKVAIQRKENKQLALASRKDKTVAEVSKAV